MRKKLIRKLFFLVIMLSGSVIFAQTTVTGTVSDVNGSIPGVNIILKGTSTGTTADFDGNYSINIPADGVLVFSSIGYTSKEVTINGQTQINIVLEPSTDTLDEVVVIGYGTMKKSDLTGAISSIKAEDLEDQPFAGIDQALAGRVSGITVTQNSGAPGGGVSIRVRGITSLTGSNEPLYVIDGVPIDGGDNNDSFSFSTLGGGNGQTKVSALSTINPADIASIEVLKDASATAIYGSRAANGVILITTKKGRDGKTTISYNTYTGIQQVTKQLDVMNLQQYAQYSSDVAVSLGQNIPFEFENPALLGEGTDWQSEIFRDAPITDHQFSVSGGSEKTKFYTSLGYFKQDGIVINTDFKRISMRLNLDHKVSNNFKIGNNITVSKSDEHITLNDDEAGIISTAVRQSPNVPVYYSNGEWGGPTDNAGISGGVNPVALSEIKNNELARVKVNGNFYGEFNFLKGFTFRSELGYDYNTGKTSVFNPTYTIGEGDNASVVTESTSIKQNTENFYWIFKNYLTYNKTINKHSINALLGQESQQSKWYGITGSRRGFLTNDIHALNAGDADTATASQYEGTNSLLSFFGRVNYNFDSKYLVTATLRADASSNFGKNNKWGYFPSFSVGWIISNEAFMENSKIVSLAKIRAGYGEVGNQNIPGYSYGAALRTTPSRWGSGFSQANIANPGVKWESTKSTNIGLELGFIQNKLKLEVDFYKKISSDFLFRQPLPNYLGAMTNADYLGLAPPYVNLGEMENTGVDLTLNARIISKEDFNWSLTGVYSMYKNKLTAMSGQNDAIYQTFEFNNTLTRTQIGEPVGQFYGHIADGIFQSIEELNNSPYQGDIDEDNGIWLGDMKFKDISGPEGIPDNIVDDYDKTSIGNPHPDFIYSLTNNLSYKDFDFTITLLGSQGNEIYNWTRRMTEGMREVRGNQLTTVLNRYIEGVNTDTDIPRYVNGDPNGNSRVSSRFVEDGSYLRIQNITLGYSIPSSVLDKQSAISRLRVYTTIQNLYTFTNYSGLDPEVGAYSQNALLMGVDNGRYPVPRTLMLGLNLAF